MPPLRIQRHQKLSSLRRQTNHVQNPFYYNNPLPQQQQQRCEDQQLLLFVSSRGCSKDFNRTQCEGPSSNIIRRQGAIPGGNTHLILSGGRDAARIQQQREQQQLCRRRLLLRRKWSDCFCDGRKGRGNDISARRLPRVAAALPPIRCCAAATLTTNESNNTVSSILSKGNSSNSKGSGSRSIAATNFTSSNSSIASIYDYPRGSSSNSTHCKVNSENPPVGDNINKQQVLVWGSRTAFPGGAEADVMRPREVSWFAEAADTRQAAFTRLSFGPSFGVAVNSRGEAAMWGSFDASLLRGQQQQEHQQATNAAAGFAHPFFLKLPFVVHDAQCSAAEIFFLSDSGRVYFLEANLLLPLLCEAYNRQQQQKVKQKHQEREQHTSTQCNEKEISLYAYIEELKVSPVELEGFPQSAVSQQDSSLWISWLGGWLPYWSSKGRRNKVRKMSIGYSHAAFLTDEGELYMCGSNIFGECGIEPDPFDEETLQVRLHRVKFLPGGVPHPQLQHSSEPKQQGNHRGKRQEEEPFIVDVACGKRHTLCLSSTGEAYAFGDDSRIELGLGDTRSQQHTIVGTTWMDRLAAHNCMATAVAAGDDFSVVLYEDIEQSYPDPLLKRNTLLCCGETALGQCGRGLQFHQQPLAAVVFPRAASAVSFNKHAAPGVQAATSRYLEGPSLIYKVDKFRCGSSHCNALMSSGKLVGWGFNPHGQVGTGPKVKGPISPAKLIDLDNANGSRDKERGGTSSPAVPEHARENGRAPASEEQLTPPLARFLRSSAAGRYKVQDIFCKFDSSAVIRALAEEGLAS